MASLFCWGRIMSGSIRLFDDQLAIVTRHAEPVHRMERGPFLERVAAVERA